MAVRYPINDMPSRNTGNQIDPACIDSGETMAKLNLDDLMRQELAAIRAMEKLNQSLNEYRTFSVPKITLPQDIFGESRIQAMVRDAIEQKRIAESVAKLVAPSLSAAASITAMIENLQPGRELAQRATAMHESWRRILPPDYLRLANFAPPSFAAHLATVSRLADTSRMLAAMIPANTIGRAFAVSRKSCVSLTARLDLLSSSYGAFYEEVGKSEEAVLALPPVLSVRPAIEYFAAADLAESTTGIEVRQEAGRELEAARTQIATENGEALIDLLSNESPDLIVLVEGARSAFASKHADYVRHFTTSLRELFTHVLHRLAPDAEVKTFSDNIEDFPNGKPTRAVRLRYICRNVNNGRFADFVKKDVAAMLAFVDLFQGGTHEVTSTYTSAQLNALLVRMEGTVQFLLEINRGE